MKILKHILVIIFCLTTFIGFGRTKTVVSPNSSHFVRINSGNLELFSLDDGTKLISIGLVEKFNIEPQNINSMILSHQGKFLLIETRFSDGNIFVIDLEKERILKKQTKESKPYLQLFAIPNSRFFVRYYKKKESRNLCCQA